MSEAAAPRVDVHVGEVIGSQLVIGDHTTVQTTKGTKVTILQAGERPVPHLRTMPVAHRPPLRVPVYGRDVELAAAASASPEAPVEIYGKEGIGKTVLLKRLAQGPGMREGVVFESARRRTLDEILLSIYSACWDCEIPYLPAPAEVQGFLVEREALVVLDDCGLDREDLSTLLDAAPRCAFVIGAEERTLWSHGSAERLRGLDPDAALQVLDHELGGIESVERGVAETLVARLEGHPQHIIEAAALISNGVLSLNELSEGAGALEARLAAQPLTDGERRIIALLGLLDGAPLGTAHISAISGISDASERLGDLERRGWVKSASPRYRLLRAPPDVSAERREASHQQLAGDLLTHLTAFARADSVPASVAEDAEAIEAALDLGAQQGWWSDVLALARASESKLAPSGAWNSWRAVLARGLQAGQAMSDESAQADMHHQLGSLALCTGDREEAARHLTRALQLRERLGDGAGAALTRHNLNQFDAGPPPGGNGKPPPGPRWPRRPMTLGLLVTAVAILIALGVVLAVGSGGPRPASATRSTTAAAPGTTSPGAGRTTTAASGIKPPVGQRPAIKLLRPANRTPYEQDSVVDASYACAPPHGSQIVVCRGTVPNGEPIDTTLGTHHFVVTAKDSDGSVTTSQATYAIAPDKTPPLITISSPQPGATYSATPANPVIVRFECTDPGGSGIASCKGSRPDGSEISVPLSLQNGPLDGIPQRTPTAQQQLTVTAIDRAGNKFTKTVTFALRPAAANSSQPTTPSSTPTTATSP